MIKNTILTLCLTVIMAFSASAEEFEITPKVSFESGYSTKITYLGIENQKASAYGSASLALQNKWLTPKLGVTYFFRGESADQVVLDASLTKTIGGDSVAVTLTAGGQKRIIQSQADNLLAYGTLKLDKLWFLTKIATPYVSVGKDFDADLFGVTVGLDRTFAIKKLEFTPYAEMYVYDNYKSYKAGGNVALNLVKYVKPFVDVSYAINEDSVQARKLDGEVLATAGIKFNF